MTVALTGKEVADKIEAQFPESIIGFSEDYILVKTDSLFDIISHLKNTPEFDFNFLSGITSADYLDYFEVVYHLVSMTKNHSLVVKTRCAGRENLSVPSVTGLYKAADIQEREVYDLMGIRFEGHPNLKRILLWEGFEGHPLRKDYL
jgi:NADH-quinone oxidoreductase subunit C